MSLSRRLRYEILRRDNHTCRYCGAKPPDVTLTVDHVVPRALGGDDSPENLATACTACNAGKAATNPDAPLVADVQQAALKWKMAIELAASLAARDQQLMRARAEGFEFAWTCQWKAVRGHEPPPLPRDYDQTIARWLARGLTIEDFADLIDVTVTAFYRSDSRMDYDDGPWRYFAGCCWRRLTELEDRARHLIESGEV